MVTFDCPWCEEDALLALAEMAEPEASFDCEECGTSVSFADEPVSAMDLAA